MHNTTAISLRPLAEPDLEVLARFDTESALSEPFGWSGFRNPRERRQRWETDGYLSPDSMSMLAVALPDGSFTGFVIWKPTSPPPRPYVCSEIGILLLPEHRGKGLGSAAQRLLCDHLFATTTVHRLEATTEVDNVAEQHALEKAGFTREGVLRGRAFVRGQYRDVVMFARLRDDPTPEPAPNTDSLG